VVGEERREQMSFLVKSEDIQGLLEELRGESDRAVAIIGAALLDEWLKQLIAGFLVDDLGKVDSLPRGPLAPLGSFASRRSASYCVGLITGDEYHDLEIVRRIRNIFAHEFYGLSFSDAKVKDICAALRLRKKARGAERIATARLAFSTTIAMLSVQLQMRREAQGLE
jgi:mannitol operon repressor